MANEKRNRIIEAYRRDALVYQGRAQDPTRSKQSRHHWAIEYHRAMREADRLVAERIKENVA